MKAQNITLLVEKYFELKVDKVNPAVSVFKGDTLKVRERDATTYWVNGIIHSSGQTFDIRGIYRMKSFIHKFCKIETPV